MPLISYANARKQFGEKRQWSYNSLDCLITNEVAEVLMSDLSAAPDSNAVYKFEMASQGPAMTMMLRGVNVDMTALASARRECTRDIASAKNDLDAITEELVGYKVNALSSPQLQKLLYDDLGCPVQTNKEGRRTVDKDARNRVARKSKPAAQVIAGVDKVKDLIEQRKVLQRGISADGRLRSSFSVGATVTGRWSSSKSPYGEGTNLQNITHKLRFFIVPDPGYELIYADLEQAESRCVAYLAGDEAYIAAHEAGNVHQMVAQILWPETPDDKDALKELMTPWDPEHSYYDWSKKFQHASNYMLSAFGMARMSEITQREAEAGQRTYFGRFTSIPRWHKHVIKMVREQGVHVSPFGRTRQFLGRSWEKSTWRTAIADEPQGMCADILNIGLYRVWKQMDPDRIQVLANVHDAILAQRKIGDDAALEEMLELMRVKVAVTDISGTTRTMTIPVDVAVGPNWRDCQ